MKIGQKSKQDALDKSLNYLQEGCQIIGFDYRYLYTHTTKKQNKSEKLLGHTMMEMYPTIEKTQFFLHLRTCIKKRKSYNIDNKFTLPNGHIGWFALRIEPIPEGAIILCIDITKRKKIETDFVSLASHALRTPLGITKWHLEAISKDNYLDDAPQSLIKYLDEIYKNNERLLILVRNLESVSRIDQGEIRNVPQHINVIDHIKALIKDMQIAALKDHVSINLTIKQTNIPLLFIDPSRLRESIQNIILNAIKYDIDNKKVEVIVTKKVDSLLISIKDHGIGISERDKKKIFTKFFRAEKAISNNTEGSGLELYVAKSYIEAWEGSITFISKEGKGSTFTIELPIKKLQKSQKL